MTRRSPRLSLRHRSTAAFAILALVLSATLALATYQLCRRYLVSKRESGATRQALIDAGVVANALRDPHLGEPALPSLLTRDVSYGALLRIGQTWRGEGAAHAPDQLPPSLLALADAQHVVRQRATYLGQTALFVAVPIPASDALYVEVLPLSDLEHTLGTIALVTALGAIATTLLGALLGALASRRVMSPLRDVAATAENIADGDFDRRLSPSNDTDLAPLVRSFNRMVGALEERVDVEARFASDVSHELRTPLTAMRSALELLDRRIGAEGRDVFEILRRECQRFEKLVLDLLEISRFDSGNQELVLEPVDPRSVVATTLRNTGHESVPMEVDPNTPGMIELDKRRVERILANLLTNADVHAGGPVRVPHREQQPRRRADRRRGRRPGNRRRRARGDLRAVSPRQASSRRARHRARPLARRRTLSGPRWKRAGRAPPERRKPVRL